MTDYDPRNDPTVGGTVALAISRLITAHFALSSGAASIDVLRGAQHDLAKAVNDYLVDGDRH